MILQTNYQQNIQEFYSKLADANNHKHQNELNSPETENDEALAKVLQCEEILNAFNEKLKIKLSDVEAENLLSKTIELRIDANLSEFCCLCTFRNVHNSIKQLPTPSAPPHQIDIDANNSFRNLHNELATRH